MSQQIKEALAAVESLHGTLPEWRDIEDPDSAEALAAEKRWLDCVRSVLEAAQQEAEAWEAIEATGGRSVEFIGPNTHLVPAGVRYVAKFRSGMQFSGASRFEALTKAAPWCRAQLAKG